jgi:hypothetical protein
MSVIGVFSQALPVAALLAEGFHTALPDVALDPRLQCGSIAIRHGLLGRPEVSARGVFAANLHLARPDRVEWPIHVEPLAHFQRRAWRLA